MTQMLLYVFDIDLSMAYMSGRWICDKIMSTDAHVIDLVHHHVSLAIQRKLSTKTRSCRPTRHRKRCC